MTQPSGRIAAAVLAAGRSKRMGTPKPTLSWRGTTFLGNIIDVLEKSGLEQRAMVVGPDLKTIREAVDLSSLTLLNNPDIDRGQLSSLWIAIEWAETDPGTDALMVCLADHPDITPEVVKRLVERFRSGPGPIVIPTYQGRRGHPTIFGRATFDALKKAPLKTGARTVLAQHPEWIDELPVDHPGVLKGANTPDELRNL
jgi:molybdenum cofactor cytidylyltransferase